MVKSVWRPLSLAHHENSETFRLDMLCALTFRVARASVSVGRTAMTSRKRIQG